MASRLVAQDRSIGETLIRDFVDVDVADTSASLTASLHALRLLNEVQDDLARHAATSYTAALQGQADAERLHAVMAVAAAVSEARVRVADACYSELDVSVNALDRRLKLMEAALRLHGQTMVEDSALGAEEKLAVLTRPPAAISGRVRKRAAPAGEGGAGAGAGAGAGGASSAHHPSLKLQLAAATGSGGVPGSPGALDLAIGSHEPHYCSLLIIQLPAQGCAILLSCPFSTRPLLLPRRRTPHPPRRRYLPAGGLWRNGRMRQ